MIDNFESRIKEWRWYIAEQKVEHLLDTKSTIVAWLKDPVHIYGTGPTAQSDLEYDQRRLVEIDAEIGRRRPQT
jgi:hypothetical protein